MMTLLTSIAMVAGLAQAQDAMPLQTAYDIRCTDTQIDLRVQVTSSFGGEPEQLLYRDGAVEETNCVNSFGPVRQGILQDELESECLVAGLDEMLCADLAADIVDQMAVLNDIPPLDMFAVQTLEDTDEDTPARFGFQFLDESTQMRRGVLEGDDGFFTLRRRARTVQGDTRLDCISRGVSFGHGLAGPNLARVELRNEVSWQCTDAAGQLDIDVSFAHKNRAVGNTIRDGMPQ